VFDQRYDTVPSPKAKFCPNNIRVKQNHYNTFVGAGLAPDFIVSPIINKTVQPILTEFNFYDLILPVGGRLCANIKRLCDFETSPPPPPGADVSRVGQERERENAQQHSSPLG